MSSQPPPPTRSPFDHLPIDAALVVFQDNVFIAGQPIPFGGAQPPPMQVPLTPHEIELADLIATLNNLNVKYPLCQFAIIPGVEAQLRTGTLPAKTAAFMCWKHAPHPYTNRGRLCRYMISSMNKAIEHAKAVVAKSGGAAPAGGDGDDDNNDDDDGGDDGDDDERDSNRRRRGDAEPVESDADRDLALIASDQNLIANWINLAEIDGVLLAQLKNDQKSCSTAADHQALLLRVITATEVGVALGTFVYQVFYRTGANTSDARAQLLSGFAALCQFYPSAVWMRCGKEFADCLMSRPAPWQDKLSTKANNLKEARKLMIDTLFHVLRAAGASANLSPLQGRAAVRANDQLRNALRAALPEGNWSSFLGHVRVAAMIALPLDLTYAVFGQERNWYSERHYRMLQAACSLGLVDVQVRALVGTLESGVAALDSTANGKERAPTKEQMLAEIEATMMAQVDVLKMPDRSKDMMNKRYEWVVALMPDFEKELSPFTTPLFWWPVEGAAEAPVVTERLHYIDMSAPKFSLQLCDALDMKRVR